MRKITVIDGSPLSEAETTLLEVLDSCDYAIRYLNAYTNNYGYQEDVISAQHALSSILMSTRDLALKLTRDRSFTIDGLGCPSEMVGGTR